MEREVLLTCLNSILASPVFTRAPRQASLLRHIVENSLAARHDQLKEFSIAAAVFDRGDDYDPQVDSTVRVEVSKLRNRLARYYEQYGAGDAIRIVVPKGGYVAEFHPTRSSHQETHPPPGPTRRWFWMVGAGAAAATVTAAGAFAILRARPAKASIAASILHAEPSDRGGASPAASNAVRVLTQELAAAGVQNSNASTAPRFIALIRAGRCWDDPSKTRIVAEIRDHGRAAAVWSCHWIGDAAAAAAETAAALEKFRRLPAENESRARALRHYNQAVRMLGEEKSFVLQTAAEKGRKANLSVLLEAAALLEEAEREDQSLPDAAAKLAWVYHLASEYDNTMQGKVREIALRALKAGPSSQANFVVGYQSLFADWNPAEAQRYFAASLDQEIFHKDAVRLHTDVACMCSWPEKATDRLIPVLSAEPRSPVLRSAAFVLAYHRHDTAEMERLARESLRWDGGAPLTRWQLGQALRAQGDFAEAARQFHLGLDRDPGSKKLLFALARLEASQGRIDKARHIAAAAGIGQSNPSLMALLEVERGDSRRAAEWIGQAISQREIALCYLALEPRIHALRTQPAFAALFDRMRLPAS